MHALHPPTSTCEVVVGPRTRSPTTPTLQYSMESVYNVVSAECFWGEIGMTLSQMEAAFVALLISYFAKIFDGNWWEGHGHVARKSQVHPEDADLYATQFCEARAQMLQIPGLHGVIESYSRRYAAECCAAVRSLERRFVLSEWALRSLVREGELVPEDGSGDVALRKLWRGLAHHGGVLCGVVLQFV